MKNKVVLAVWGLMTSVNKLKKKSVAFGFKTLVKKPWLMALRGEISFIWIWFSILISEEELMSDLKPRYNK